MKEFAISTDPDYQRPVIELYNLPTLIDTGAVIPVISIYPSIIEKYFDMKLIMQNKSISGFGGEEGGSIYSISEFKIGELNFENFECFVPNEPKLKFPLLLSATLFYGMIYEFNTINNKFVVRANNEQSFKRNFKIKSIKGKLYPQIDGILCQDTDLYLKDFWF